MSDIHQSVRDELEIEFSKNGMFSGEIRFDKGTRYLYSTDASIYQVEPIGVLIPRHTEDLISAVEITTRHKVPILARGSGSSLAGQAIGPAIILDCTKYLNKCIEINPEEHWAIIEPGLILSMLNKHAARFGFQFGPDPASAERASLGGCISNNATGAHSIMYGMTADHVIELDMIFADASWATVQNLSEQEIRTIRGETAYPRLVQFASGIHEKYKNCSPAHWPETWRRVSGYNLNYLIPWSPTRPPMWYLEGEKPYPPFQPDEIALPALFAGAEGTLGVIQRAKVNLVKRPKNTILGAVAYPSIVSACDDVERILAMQPSAIELIPRSILELARSVPGFAGLVSIYDELRDGSEDPAAILVTEFCGDIPSLLLEKVKALGTNVLVAQTALDQRKIWDVRKVGLGILMSRPGQPKPVAFIEDLSVPITKLGFFVQEMEKILADCGTSAEFYAHASAGCLHIRPILNLNDRLDQKKLRNIADQAVYLTINLGGAVSGEHGDGYARSEWIQRAYGETNYDEFRNLKNTLDPENLMNPGKIVGSPPLDENLRTGMLEDRRWIPEFDFRGLEKDGLSDAVELCNGAGVCKKSDGLMCPSFQALGDEIVATRGRANLLRAMIYGHIQNHIAAESLVFEALDLCLACKGCKAECPSSVDVAKLRYEFLHHYYKTKPRKFRDYLFAYIGTISQFGYPFRSIVNLISKMEFFQTIVQPLFKVSQHRHIPYFSRQSFTDRVLENKLHQPNGEQVFFLVDTFHQFFYPNPAVAGLNLLLKSGQSVTVLPFQGAARTMISKGFLPSARKHLRNLVNWLKLHDPEGLVPVVGVEPSEIYTLRDELLDLLPGDKYVAQLTNRSWTIEEYLIRPDKSGVRRFNPISISPGNSKEVVLHGHCYQKAQPPSSDTLPIGTAAAIELLTLAGYSVRPLESGCCGMAGAFGYEQEHYDISQKIGNLKLFPALRQRGEALVSVCGVSCKSQVEDALGIEAFHPLELALQAMDDGLDNT